MVHGVASRRLARPGYALCLLTLGSSAPVQEGADDSLAVATGVFVKEPNGGVLASRAGETNGVNDRVEALAVYHDGIASALYAGGLFTVAGGAPASRIAKWNGLNWSPLGSGIEGVSQGGGPYVKALAVYDDGGGGALYAGGRFTSPGASLVKWDGSSWTEVGGGVDGEVRALAMYDDGSGPALYVGGNLPSAGGVQMNNIAKWNGSSWSQLGHGLNGPVMALTVFESALYAGGSFTWSGGVEQATILKWDGSTWTRVGSGTDGSIEALTMHDDGGGNALYAGGNFTTAGGVTAYDIARWDGSTWTPVGGGIGGIVRSLCTLDDGNGSALYAGGVFTIAGGFGGVPANSIAKWDGSTWTALGTGIDGLVYALAGFDDGTPDLYAGGEFTAAGGASASNMAKWNGSSWSALSGASTYCTAGTSALGCQALISSTGTASASAPAGFTLLVSGVESQKDGLFFFGANGKQANPWGTSTSFQCVVPPVVRAGLLPGSGATLNCDASFTQDLNALWCPTCPKPSNNPGAGAVVQAQFWYRNPQSPVLVTTALSDAIEFPVAP